MKFFNKLFLSKFLLFSLVLLPLQAVKSEDVGGVVLSFDDTYVDHWYDYFGKRTDNAEVKATFFVSHWHTLSDDEIKKLRRLRAMGHEIGNHTYSHKGVAGDYNFDPGRIQEYLDDQIIPSIANMAADGFHPVSFSYPSGERNETYDAAVRRYFPYLRTTFADENKKMFQMDDIYHGPNSEYQVLAGDGVDNSYGNPISEIESAFMRAKTKNEVVILYAHRILENKGPDSDHRFGIRKQKLNRIITAAKDMGLKFYTFAEAWQLGNKREASTDVNATVRGNKVAVSWNNVAADFVGIVPVEQDEWDNSMPGAAVSGSSGQIKISVPKATDPTSYRAVLYKNFTRVARSNVVVVAGSGSGGSGSGGSAPSASPKITFLGIDEGKARFQWDGLVTDFIGIVPVGEREWRPGMPWADAHGSASDKIGLRVEPQSTDRQYVAIFYRDSAEVGRSVVFTIKGI